MERFNDNVSRMEGLNDANAVAVEFETMRRSYHGSAIIMFDIFLRRRCPGYPLMKNGGRYSADSGINISNSDTI
ncbi:hypothetical protein ACFSQ7_34760 [Paenibacillus rhizoplanae]